MIVTLEEIDQLRTQLANNPAALRSLDMIEDCEGDVEDAAISLALRVGQEPGESERWLEGVAKRWRAFICHSTFRQALESGSLDEAIQLLASETSLPAELTTPVLIYVLKTGIEPFCKPLEELLG